MDFGKENVLKEYVRYAKNHSGCIDVMHEKESGEHVQGNAILNGRELDQEKLVLNIIAGRAELLIKIQDIKH